MQRDTEEKGKRTKEERERNNNRAIDVHRVSNTYVLNMFVEFVFLQINMHCFLDL